ncbi:MAG: hypothetical protein P8K79_03625 [Mariniblastus sp.]|nr:hypothetical protein [Mariniblastus sp.]
MTTVSRFCFLRWPLAGVALLLLATTWTTESRAQSPASQHQRSALVLAIKQAAEAIPAPVIMLTNTKVQKELNLTETQIAETAEPAQKLKSEFMSLAFDPEYRDQPGKIQAMIGKIKGKEKEIFGRLNRQQQQRLQQLSYQLLGLRLFQNVDVQKTLQLTEGQQQQIKQVYETGSNKSQASMTLSKPPSRSSKEWKATWKAGLEANQEKSNRFHAEVREAINQVLTEKQREQVAQMKGKPFAPFANLW